MNRPLRVGLLCDSPSLPRYLFEPLKKLADEGKLQVVLVCLNLKPHRPSLWSRLPKLCRGVVELLFKKLSRTASQASHHSLNELCPNAKTLHVTPISRKFSDRLAEEDLHQIRESNCDFLVRNGFKILRGGVLHAASQGVLSFHHGDNFLNRGGPPMYWEFAERWDNTGAILQVLTEELDGGRVVDRAYSELIPWDYHLSQNNLADTCGAMLYRFLDQFHTLPQKRSAWTDQFYDRRLYTSPSNLLALWHAANFLGYLAWTTCKKMLWKEKWRLFLGPVEGPARRYAELSPPQGEFWADPFLWSHEDRHYVYFERYRYKDRIGTLGVLELNQQLKVIRDTDVQVGETCHLSFPNVLSIDNQLYLLPEAGESNRLTLYRCTEFPHRFEPAAVLLHDVHCLDSSLIQHEDRWWLFTSHAVSGGKSPIELQLYSSADPLSCEWVKHPQSPLAIDVRKGRNGGQLFHRNSKLYRIAQDGTRRYGRRMAVYQVDTLNQHQYHETFLRYIEPAWQAGLNRCHTFNVCGDLAVVDAAKDQLRFRL